MSNIPGVVINFFVCNLITWKGIIEFNDFDQVIEGSMRTAGDMRMYNQVERWHLISAWDTLSTLILALNQSYPCFFITPFFLRLFLKRLFFFIFESIFKISFITAGNKIILQQSLTRILLYVDHKNITKENNYWTIYKNHKGHQTSIKIKTFYKELQLVLWCGFDSQLWITKVISNYYRSKGARGIQYNHYDTSDA